jgi:hypothetical protein
MIDVYGHIFETSVDIYKTALFDPEDGGSVFFQMISKHLTDCMVSHPRRH